MAATRCVATVTSMPYVHFLFVLFSPYFNLIEFMENSNSTMHMEKAPRDAKRPGPYVFFFLSYLS
jgi:hypothetical protein